MIKMMKCRACSNTVAQNAKSCPHCGCTKPARRFTMVIVIFIVLIMGALMNAGSGG